MPTYDFKNLDTGEITEYMMSVSQMEQFKADNPNMQQVISAPKNNMLTNRDGSVLRKAGDGWKEVQDKIKKGFDTGLFANHPFIEGKKLPIFVANFVLKEYGRELFLVVLPPIKEI